MRRFLTFNLSLLLTCLFTIGSFTACQNSSDKKNTTTKSEINHEKKEDTKVEIPTAYEPNEPLTNLKTKDLIYAWVDKLNIRDKASLKGKAIASVDSNDPLEFTGEKSGEMQTVVLRGKAYEDNWYKIKTEDKKEGWVFGGAVKRKEEKKGNEPITNTKFDFPHFGSFDLSEWKKLAVKTEGEEVDYKITMYQKGDRFLEYTTSDMGEMHYGYDYKLLDKNKEILKERNFSFSGMDKKLEEKVKDYTTNKVYTRSQTLKQHWYQLNEKPMMANGAWNIKDLEEKTTKTTPTTEKQ